MEQEKKLKKTDTLSLGYTITEDVTYEITVEDLFDEFGIDLEVDTIEEMLEKYPTTEAIGKVIEDNISIQNLGDYSTYSDVEAEVMYDCSLAELNR